MDHLLRSHAPISEAAWKLLDEEARERLVTGLAARRLVDFQGPKGWEFSASNLGRTEVVKEADSGSHLEIRQRKVLPLVEVRTHFKVDREELSDVDRGAVDVDLADLDRAALAMVVAENRAVFHGWPAVGMQGIAEASPHPPLNLTEDVSDYLQLTAKALGLFLQIGIAGPYCLVLSTQEYVQVAQAMDNGYPLLRHLERILGSPITWAPGVEGAVLASARGGDFSFESGQDLAVGYGHHDAQSVYLYIEQSFSFQVLTPEAAVAMIPA